MRNETAVAIAEATVPLPFILGGALCDGIDEKQPSCCIRCAHRNCINSDRAPRFHHVCTEGLSYYRIPWFDQTLCLNGLINLERNLEVSADRRRDLRRLHVSNMHIHRLMDRLSLLERAVTSELEVISREAVSFLHEVRSSLSVVMHNCETVIASGGSGNFSNALDNASRPMRNLYDSIGLLSEQLGLADVISNPDSIRYGGKNPCSLNGFLYRFIKMFEARAASKGVRIYLSCHREYRVALYNSFQFIPLILLDNALKYCEPKTIINVAIEDDETDVLFSVTSFGATVEKSHWEKIFERHQRGPNALGVHPNGSGLGLAVAKAVVHAHGFDISYSSDQVHGEHGLSVLTVQIPASMCVISNDQF